MVFPRITRRHSDSSVLHHVTSFNEFSVARVYLTPDRQVAQLKPGGVIIVRDFVIPDGPETVYLDLSATDGAAAGAIPELSGSALFEHFSATWRSSVNHDEPVPFRRLPSTHPGFVRYEVALRAATEFVLRKDYRADWATEALEEYTYFTQSDFESAFSCSRPADCTSRPLEPVDRCNRFEKSSICRIHRSSVAVSTTNYLIVGEKSACRRKLRSCWESDSQELAAPNFLSITRIVSKRPVKYLNSSSLIKRSISSRGLNLGGRSFIFARRIFLAPSSCHAP